jgi:hypothetical protein
VLDGMQDQLDSMPDHGRATTDRRIPFRNPQGLDGATHFLTRTLDKVRTEMSLQVLA